MGWEWLFDSGVVSLIEMRKVRLPFVESFKSAIKRGLSKTTVDGNLGETFYPRLHAIHNNIVDAIVHNQTDYLATVASPALNQ